MKQWLKILSACAMAVSLLGCIAAPIEMTTQTEQRLPQCIEFLEPYRNRARQSGA
jgi:hypothetical protein